MARLFKKVRIDRLEIKASGTRFRRLVGAFQQKGATSPEKALTAEELGLLPRFEEYMDSHSGQTKVFVEVNRKLPGSKGP